MSDEQLEIRDVGLVDRIVRVRRWEAEQPDGKVKARTQSVQQLIPEEIMAELESHLGDAQAKVTVGAELGHSRDYGCKAGAFVSVSVHCNNHEDDIQAVHETLHNLARNFVNEDLEVMKQDRDSHMGAAPPQQPAAGKVSQSAATKAKNPNKTVKPKVTRPSFRR